jgi:predicted transposase YbfD/YdcC
LGQVATDAKSNEITAIPHLLNQIDLPGTLITIDAMGCQKEIVEQVVVDGGDCVIAVKDNQPKLAAAIQTFFLDHMEDNLKGLRHRHHETHEDGHGRIDDRYYYLAGVPRDFACGEDWPWVKAIGCTVRITRHGDGRETDDVRYYLSSRYLSGRRFAEAVRGHWGIESMHWVLDVNFREDESRTRERTLGNQGDCTNKSNHHKSLGIRGFFWPPTSLHCLLENGEGVLASRTAIPQVLFTGHFMVQSPCLGNNLSWLRRFAVTLLVSVHGGKSFRWRA